MRLVLGPGFCTDAGRLVPRDAASFVDIAKAADQLGFYGFTCSDHPAVLTSFDGQFFSFTDIRQLPVPCQQPHPPIWVGGNSTRALRRAVAFGDAWFPFHPPPSLATIVASPTLDENRLRDRIALLRRMEDT